MKKSFLQSPKPIFTAMLQVRKPEDAFPSIERAKTLKTDAFGLQIEQLEKSYRTEEVYRDMFEKRMDEYPVYVTSYRSGLNGEEQDEALMEELLRALRCGATLGDIMGNTFDRSATDELTENPAAVEKQRRLIDKIHDMGKEVLISSHIWRALPAERVVEIALAQQARGADVSKVVVVSNTPEEEVENLRILTLLKKELKIPFLFLCGGSHCRLLRLAGGYFGNALHLCVERHDELATPAQPNLEIAKRFWTDLQG